MIFILKNLMILLGILVFLKFYEHLLLVLISFEFLSMISMYLISESMYSWFMVYFLVYSVCDSVLGLGLIVMMLRSYGNEYISNLSMSKW